jgi:hypothetical protein
MFDELMDELRDVIEERSAIIYALANEIETADELQTFVALVETKLQTVVVELEHDREARFYRNEG